MNHPQLRAAYLILSSILVGLLSAPAAFALEDALPPYTDYCEMLAQEIQGRKHAFLAGNLTYYIGGQYACCDAISIRILPQVGFCMGVHEIQLQFDD